jgi:hypothetical protein
MIRKTPHKDLDNPPGQITNSISNPGHTIKREKELNMPWPEKRLSDIIRNTHERDKRDTLLPGPYLNRKKKLTFEEWYTASGWEDIHRRLSLDDADSSIFIMKKAWEASQEYS